MLELILGSIIGISAPKTEVQVSICEPQQSLRSKLDPSQWSFKHKNQTYFIENPELVLWNQGWRIRIRVYSGSNTAQVTVKRNYSKPKRSHSSGTIPKEAKCEYDLHGQTKSFACKITNTVDYRYFETARESNNWVSLLSESQVKWLQDENLMDDLLFKNEDFVFAGPFKDRVYEKRNEKPKVVLELSTAGPLQFSEFSSRTQTINENIVQQKLNKYLNDSNVSICKNQNEQSTKAKLAYFFRAHQ